MNKEMSIIDISIHLLRDVYLDGFDLQAYKSDLIQKVLEYGDMRDWELLKELYGLKYNKGSFFKFKKPKCDNTFFFIYNFQY